MKMNNYQKFILLLQNYLKENLAISDDNIEELSKRFLSDMKNASLNDNNNYYLYDGDKKLNVIKMDDFTDFYCKIKSNTTKKENNINAVDAFLINKDKYVDYAYEIKRKMFDLGIRVEVDDRNEKIGYKIREAQVKKVPYSIIVGESELENKNISVRKRREKDTITMDTDEFINNLLEEIKTKAQ
jgi:histidyl-tRNA synthetase